MEKRKRAIAFLMAMSVIGVNTSMILDEKNGMIAFAEVTQVTELKITSQPKDVMVANGATATFKVTAQGEGLKYQWYYSNPNTTNGFKMSSNTTDTYTITASQNSHNKGFQVYCVVTDSAGNSVQSETATMTLGTALSITSQPKDVMIANGATATFKVTAQGEGLKYQWYYSNPNTTNGFKMSSNTTDTYTITASQNSHNKGFQVYCVVTDSAGNSVQSETATMTLGTALSITSQPKDVMVANGATATFKVTAQGEGLKYQWYYSNPNTTNGFKMSSNTTDTYTITASQNSHNKGFQVYCVVTDSAGNSVQSETATMTLGTALSITSQPKDVMIANGATATFKVTAQGEGLKYQWYYSNPNTTNGFKMSSNTTDTYTITASQNSHNKGFQVYCVVTDSAGNSVQSETATMTLGTALSITSQPKDVMVANGATATFKVTAQGEGLKYQWYYSNPNTTNGFKMSSNTTDTYTITASQNSHNKGFQVYCVVTDSAGNSVQSETATMTLVSQITLTTPESVTIESNSSATFTVSATGTGDLTYLWEALAPDSSTWTAIPNSNSATLTVDASSATSGTQYRCTVSDAYGQSKTSEPATLTIESASKPCGDNLTYTYKNGTLTISGTGEMWSYTDAESSPFNELDIDTLVIEDGVTVIGTHAFEGNSIQSVILPDSVFSVRYKAFSDNLGLDITIENIGCAIYKDAINGDATIQGYANSSAYDYAQANGQAFVSLNDDSYNGTSNKLVLTKGESATINVSGNGIKYRSFNNDIVTVSSDGTVTAVGDGEARVIAYDKQGNTTVFYYTVVEERNHPDPTRRYQIVSPASSEQSVALFGDESISLNEDVAIAEGNYAHPAGSFGTAPILSVDNIGNSDIFYYTFDADIRPVNADVTYTEDVYALNNDWDYTYLNPYYSFTAEEDTRVYFKAYGEYDLNVSVYALPGIDPIAEDYNGGRAEVSFDVNAGETVYIQVSDSQNKSFPYTMSLSTTGIEVVEMSENEIYTITPDISGDLTTLSFTATEAGSYMIEGIGTTDFHYDFSDNSSFDNSNSIWPVLYDDEVLSYYYPNIEAGETVYIRGYFDNETTSDDLISFRVNAVTPVDTALTLNDMDNPNVLSFNPDDFDRRTIEGKAGAQYIISTDSGDTDVIVWDQNGNVVGLDHESNETGYTYFFNCDEDQIYYVLAIPTHTYENYGSVNVWVWENTDQAININLWDAYSFYNSRRAPVDYTFTAPMTGYYYLTSEYTGATSYVYTDEDGLAHEESFDPTFSMYIYDNDYNTLHSFSLTPGTSEKGSAFYLEEGQTVKINFYQYELRGSDHIDFSLNWAKPGFIDVDRIQDNTIDANNTVWYEFTAPANGTYLFTACNNDPLSAESNWYEFCIGTKDGLDWINNNQGCAECTREMTEGETVYLRIDSSEDSPLSYKLGVINCDQPFNTNLLENTNWDVADSNCAEIYYFTENGFILNVTDEGDEVWDTQVYAADFPVFEGNYYKLTFTKEGPAESERIPETLLQQNHYPYATYGGYNEIDMIADVSEIYFAVEGTSGLTKLLFDNFGVGTYTFSDIELVRITEKEYLAWEESLDDNLIDNASKWSSYCVDYASDDPTHTFEANQVNIQLPVGFSGNFGAKYSGIQLFAGDVVTVNFDLLTDGMTSADVIIKDYDGEVIEQFYGSEFGIYDEAQTNTFTFTAPFDTNSCDLIFYFYTDSVTEGSIPSSFVTISNISLAVTGYNEILPEDIIDEEICEECGGVKPDHEDWCSHYGEDDEEESYDD